MLKLYPKIKRFNPNIILNNFLSNKENGKKMREDKDSVNFPIHWYSKQLMKLGDLKEYVKFVASIIKEDRKDEFFVEEKFTRTDFPLKKINKLIYLYEIRNRATLLILGDKEDGYMLYVNTSNPESQYVVKLLELKLIDVKHEEEFIVIYEPTSSFRDVFNKISQKG